MRAVASRNHWVVWWRIAARRQNIALSCTAFGAMILKSSRGAQLDQSTINKGDLISALSPDAGPLPNRTRRLAARVESTGPALTRLDPADPETPCVPC